MISAITLKEVKTFFNRLLQKLLWDRRLACLWLEIRLTQNLGIIPPRAFLGCAATNNPDYLQGFSSDARLHHKGGE
jgi:hypothetical protein